VLALEAIGQTNVIANKAKINEVAAPPRRGCCVRGTQHLD